MSRVLSFTLAAVLLVGTAAIASSGHRYVNDCGSAKMRPSSITITCGDANAAAINLHWSSWGGTEAHAAGKFAYNDCKPSCAAGSGKTVPATVTLRHTAHCGYRSFYKQMVVHFTHSVPSGYHRTSAFGL